MDKFVLNGHTSELAAWLALNRIPALQATILELLSRFPKISDLFQEKKTLLRALGLSEGIIQCLQNPDWKSVEDDLAWQEKENQVILTLEDPKYPAWLKTIPDPPMVLYVKGQADVLRSKQIAIVGSRNPTHSGRALAFDFAKGLSEQGLIITSGLAIGIDAAAHQGALANCGATVAVCGTGLAYVYPRQNGRLAEAIIEKGALISEFPLQEQARPLNFPRRNRIISGLSCGVLVVEATMKSGSLITARLALEQGREVFAIPGSIHNPLAKGCHLLIRQGAKLVETYTDIFEELPALNKKENSIKKGVFADSAKLKKEVAILWKNLEFEPTPVDVLVERTGWSVSTVVSMLSELELQGKVAATAGGYIKLE